MNTLYFGNNLEVLREKILDNSQDLIIMYIIFLRCKEI
jgi:hypothetical protein